LACNCEIAITVGQLQLHIYQLQLHTTIVINYNSITIVIGPCLIDMYVTHSFRESVTV